jgi:hypothetical protein
MNNESPSTDFPANWRETLTEMQHEWARLNKEVAQLRSERDQLAKALLAMLPDEVTLSDEEILAQIGREQPISEFLQDLRAEVAEK